MHASREQSTKFATRDHFMIIAVINQKGGVGKTTTTVNLGVALAQAGHKVLLLDLDMQRDLSSHHGLENLDELLQIVTTTPPQLLPTLEAHEYDFALIDCPPALGEEAGAALTHCDWALVPVAPEFLAVRGLSRLLTTIEAARRVNPKLRAHSLVTMLDARAKSAPTYTEALRALRPCPALETTVGRSILFERASAKGQSILQFAPRSIGAAAYRAVAKEIVTKIRPKTHAISNSRTSLSAPHKTDNDAKVNDTKADTRESATSKRTRAKANQG